MDTIDLLRVANDLVIAGPRPRAHGPPSGDRHRPAVARDVSAFNANRARQASRPVFVYQDALRRFQRAPVTALPVRQDEHRPHAGNGRGSYRVERSATGGVMLPTAQPLSVLLRSGVRFLPHPLPAPLSTRLAACLPMGSDTGLSCSACLPEWGRSSLSADDRLSTTGKA
jgi:hypothetical protein